MSTELNPGCAPLGVIIGPQVNARAMLGTSASVAQPSQRLRRAELDMSNDTTSKAEYGSRPKDFTFRGMPSWVREMYRITERNANRRSIPFNLSRQEFREIVERSEGRCMMTGIEFEFERHEGSCRRPFAPSLDRKESLKGYSAGNCRLICVLMNLAMNQWGLDPLLKVASHLVMREAELSKKEDLQDEYCPAEFITTAEFCNKYKLDHLSQFQRNALGGLTGRMCWTEGLAIGQRGAVKAYPESLLDKAYHRMAVSRV